VRLGLAEEAATAGCCGLAKGLVRLLRPVPSRSSDSGEGRSCISLTTQRKVRWQIRLATSPSFCLPLRPQGFSSSTRLRVGMEKRRLDRVLGRKKSASPVPGQLRPVFLLLRRVGRVLRAHLETCIDPGVAGLEDSAHPPAQSPFLDALNISRCHHASAYLHADGCFLS